MSRFTITTYFIFNQSVVHIFHCNLLHAKNVLFITYKNTFQFVYPQLVFSDILQDDKDQERPETDTRELSGELLNLLENNEINNTDDEVPELQDELQEESSDEEEIIEHRPKRKKVQKTTRQRWTHFETNATCSMAIISLKYMCNQAKCI